MVVTNPGPNDLVLTSLVDDIYGNLNGRGTCRTGGTLVANGGSYTCSFTGTFTGRAGDSQTDTVTAEGVDRFGNRVSDRAPATVRLTGGPAPAPLPPPAPIVASSPPAPVVPPAAPPVVAPQPVPSPPAAVAPQRLVRTGPSLAGPAGLATFLLTLGFFMVIVSPDWQDAGRRLAPASGPGGDRGPRGAGGGRRPRAAGGSRPPAEGPPLAPAPASAPVGPPGEPLSSVFHRLLGRRAELLERRRALRAARAGGDSGPICEGNLAIVERQLRQVDRQIREELAASGFRYQDLYGVGPLVAARIVAEAGDLPLTASELRRRAPAVIRRVALAQRRGGGEGQALHRACLADGSTEREALERLERHLARVLLGRLTSRRVNRISRAA